MIRFVRDNLIFLYSFHFFFFGGWFICHLSSYPLLNIMEKKTFDRVFWKNLKKTFNCLCFSEKKLKKFTWEGFRGCNVLEGQGAAGTPPLGLSGEGNGFGTLFFLFFFNRHWVICAGREIGHFLPLKLLYYYRKIRCKICPSWCATTHNNIPPPST